MDKSFRQFRHRGFSTLILIIIVYLPLVPSYADPVAKITLLEQSPQSLVLELTVPDPVIYDENLSGNMYQAIRYPGMGRTNEPGKPEVPTMGGLIAVPRDSQIQLETVDSETEMLSDILLPPAPTPVLNRENGDGHGHGHGDASSMVYTADVQAYGDDRFLPASPVKVGMNGYIREQRVAQIQFFPVRYNAAKKTVELYKRLRVKVNFIDNNLTSSVKKTTPVIEGSPAFDTMLRQLLLNDQTANRVLRTRSTTKTTKTTREACPSPLPPALKLSIDKTGVYALSHADFMEMLGLDLSVLDSRQIQMTHLGDPVQLYIAGKDDGIFGPGDVMYFYAQAANTPYTRTNIYWLSLNPEGGARLNFRDGTPDVGNPPLTEFTRTLHLEANDVYWVVLPKEPEKDHFFWKRIRAGESHDMSVTLRHIAKSAAAGNATVRVNLQGRTSIASVDPDHHTQILLNSVNISDDLWDGDVEYQQVATLPQSSLLEGENTVSLFSVGETGALVDSLYVNWLEIDYLATTTAIEDQLTFDAVGEGLHYLSVGGFSQPEILVLDVTNPRQVVPLFGTTVQADGAGSYQIQYSDNLESGKEYYAFTVAENHLLKPAAIEIDVPITRLQSPCNRADYFIIHHDSFNVDALKSLVMAHDLQEVMAVPVSDIYDEFNHGMPNPRAIKDFLSYAYKNYTQPRPAYVALVGDANQDLLNELGHGINYVPTNLFYTELLGVTATDNEYVTLSGDDALPDMYLGRISVRTQSELDAIVNKLVRYSQAPGGNWQRNILFVTDTETRNSFENTAERLIEKHLADYSPERIYLSQYDGDNDTIQANVRADIIEKLDTGSLVTNYIGHGNIGNWASLFIFQSSDVVSLDNPDKLTFLVTLNCLNGWFSYYQPFFEHDDSLAEAFLKGDGKGAVGVWAPTGEGYTHEHEVLSDELFRQMFEEKVTELGHLTTMAKIAAVAERGLGRDNLETFTLFGEPSLHLRLE